MSFFQTCTYTYVVISSAHVVVQPFFSQLVTSSDANVPTSRVSSCILTYALIVTATLPLPVRLALDSQVRQMRKEPVLVASPAVVAVNCANHSARHRHTAAEQAPIRVGIVGENVRWSATVDHYKTRKNYLILMILGT